MIVFFALFSLSPWWGIFRSVLTHPELRSSFNDCRTGDPLFVCRNNSYCFTPYVLSLLFPMDPFVISFWSHHEWRTWQECEYWVMWSTPAVNSPSQQIFLVLTLLSPNLLPFYVVTIIQIWIQNHWQSTNWFAQKIVRRDLQYRKSQYSKHFKRIRPQLWPQPNLDCTLMLI